jgi:hypothetical protein
MGKIYKRKRRSCKMCKPHKMGWAPKETKRQMQEREIAEKESRALHRDDDGEPVSNSDLDFYLDER